MAYINPAQLRFEVERQITQTKAFRQAAIATANERFDQAKSDMMESFDDSIVTREIKEGPDKPESDILPNGYGNLFSFLGFDRGSTPAEDLRAILEENTTLTQRPITEAYRYVFKAYVPTDDEINDATPMPRGVSKSWVYAVENGIPGFAKYLFDLNRSFATSSSGPAIQVKSQVRGQSFEGQGYVTPIIKAFRAFFEQ